jgi:hypothetical protein
MQLASITSPVNAPQEDEEAVNEKTSPNQNVTEGEKITTNGIPF